MRRKTVLEDETFSDNPETKTILPSVRRKRNFIQQISEHKSTSSLETAINTNIASAQTKYWFVPPIALGLTFYKINSIWRETQKIFCEDLPRIPESGCWNNKSQHGVTWGDWFELGMAVAPLIVYAYVKWSRKPIFIPLAIDPKNMLSEAELRQVKHSIQADDQASGRKIYSELTKKNVNLKSILKDRSAALTFFISSRQIQKGQVFTQGVRQIVADFLGCPDLVDHSILKPTELHVCRPGI